MNYFYQQSQSSLGGQIRGTQLEVYSAQTHQGRTSGQGHGSLLEQGNADDGQSMKSVIINNGRNIIFQKCYISSVIL